MDTKPGFGSRCCAHIRSANFLLYCSHALSAWGDRMWAFATGMFLVALSPCSLRLTAAYGFVSGITLLLSGAAVGVWVDRTPRLRVARTCLVVQNLSVCVSAGLVCLVVRYKSTHPDLVDSWLEVAGEAGVIAFAVVANVASVGRSISVEKDWIVVISGDREALTDMSALLRRIDLVTKLIAPIVTGQVITYGSVFIGAVFIAVWNAVSVFIEYFLLHAVYRSVPELAYKETPAKVSVTSSPTERSPILEHPSNGRVETSEDLTRHRDVAGGPACGPDCCLLAAFRGWTTYMRHPIVLAGLSLSGLYLTVLGFDNVTTGFAKQQGLSESVIGVIMGVGALIGIVGTVLFPVLRRAIGLRCTGLVALAAEVVCLSICVVSVFAPGSPFDPRYLAAPPNVTACVEVDVENRLDGSAVASSTSANGFALGGSASVDDGSRTPLPWESRGSVTSVALLMAGIVTSRLGLWMADLTVTQLLLESPEEGERGVVNGVQSSLNNVVDLLKFLLVIALPLPQSFGFLVIVSFVAVVTSCILFACYTRRARALEADKLR